MYKFLNQANKDAFTIKKPIVIDDVMDFDKNFNYDVGEGEVTITRKSKLI